MISHKYSVNLWSYKSVPYSGTNHWLNRDRTITSEIMEKWQTEFRTAFAQCDLWHLWLALRSMCIDSMRPKHQQQILSSKFSVNSIENLCRTSSHRNEKRHTENAIVWGQSALSSGRLFFHKTVWIYRRAQILRLRDATTTLLFI